MPKLLQINECLNLSTGKIAQQIGELAISTGWESWIAYSGREREIPSKSHLIKVGSFMDSCIHYVENKFLDNEGLSSQCATKKLIARIKDIQPDIIQLHNIHDHWLNYKFLFEYFNHSGVKVVWTLHDCWAFTGHCFHFVTKKCDRWKAGCYDCPLKNEYPKTVLDRSRKNYELKKKLFGENKNLTIVPVSDWISAFVKESFLKEKNIHVIKNGVDLKTFTPSYPKLSSKDGKFRILAISNVWNKEKGYYDIFKLRELLSDDYIITIVGLSIEQIKKLPAGIVGIKRTQNAQELVKLYSSSDLLINPTYADTFPTVNIEALACGIPVITYQTGGSPEAIDENTGFVIEQGNISAFISAIKQIRMNPFSSIDCRKRAKEYFDKNKCFEEYVMLYEELLK